MKRMIRKFVFLAALVAMVVFATASCGVKPGDEPPGLPETNTKPEIALEIVDMQKGSWGKKTATFKITNNTENVVLYGRTYRLLYFDGNAWKEAKALPMDIPLDAFVVEPGESREQTFVLTSRYFINGRKQYFFTLDISEQLPSGGYEEFRYGVLLNPEEWQ